MSFENIFGPDSLSIEKNRILGLLEREGQSDEAMSAVLAWTEQMEARSLISSKEMVRFNVDRAALYEAIGDIEGMFETLAEAFYQIKSEKDSGNEPGDWQELYDKVEALLKEMDAKYPTNNE